MDDQAKKDAETKQLSRREFFKNAGVTVAGTALAVALPVLPGPGTLAVSPQRIVLKYTCPLDGHDFPSYAELKQHFAAAHPTAVVPGVTTLQVNGQEYQVQSEPHRTLQHVLQFGLGLTGTKTMCDRGECGSCTVLLAGKPVLACSVLAVECENKEIETIEGIAADPKWEPLIRSYMKYDAMQCGYCTPGFLVTAKALLTQNRNPTNEDIKQALAGNICRCVTYPRHVKAILEAAQELNGGR